MQAPAARIKDVIVVVISKNVDHKAEKKRRDAPLFPRVCLFLFVDLLLSGDALAGLIADGAARLAGGLAGASAFPATRDFLLRRFCNGLDHKNFLSL